MRNHSFSRVRINAARNITKAWRAAHCLKDRGLLRTEARFERTEDFLPSWECCALDGTTDIGEAYCAQQWSGARVLRAVEARFWLARICRVP